MRISSDRSHAWYNPYFYLFDIYLEGKKVEDCLAADDKNNVIWVAVKGPDNRLVVVNDVVMVKPLYGEIEIKIRTDNRNKN